MNSPGQFANAWPGTATPPAISVGLCSGNNGSHSRPTMSPPVPIFRDVSRQDTGHQSTKIGTTVVVQPMSAPKQLYSRSMSVVVRQGFNQALEVTDLQVGDEPFSPSSSLLRPQILAKLSLPSNAMINEMQGFKGGLNEGIWFVSAAGVGQDLVLKLVRGHRIASSVLTEAENLVKISQQRPMMTKDPLLAFPIKIFSCLSRSGVKRHDLIVMRKARGERLAEWIARKWYGAQVPFMLQVFERVGCTLADFHSRYSNAQHGDFQPSNIFYDEERDDLSFIDIGGVAMPTRESDVEHFVRSLELLAETYGQQFMQDSRCFFEQGYRRRQS